jgi:hypothetical protein
MNSRFGGDWITVPADSNTPLISVPSLSAGDEIWIVHRFCGQDLESNHVHVGGSLDARPGDIQAPLFDGDTVVIVKDVTAGAWVELWVEGSFAPLQQGLAPFSDSDEGQVDVAFSRFGRLQWKQKILFKTSFCGQDRQIGPVPVGLRTPVIDNLAPPSAFAGSRPLTLSVLGKNFRSSTIVLVHFPERAAESRTTTFISETEVRAQITAADAAAPTSFDVMVENPDGQLSGTKPFRIVARPSRPPPPRTGWTLTLRAEPNPVLVVPKISIDEIKWTVTPAWNPAAKKELTGVPSAAGIQASSSLPVPPSGASHTVAVTATIKCSTAGGVFEGRLLLPGTLPAVLDGLSVGYDTKNQKVGWLCQHQPILDTSGQVVGIGVHGIVLSIVDV